MPFFLIVAICRYVVTVLKLEGPNYDGPLSSHNKYGGTSILLPEEIPKYWEGPGPLAPLGDYTPDMYPVNDNLVSENNIAIPTQMSQFPLAMFIFNAKS